MPHRPDLTAGNLLPAALGGVAAALLVSSFGIAGSLVGAALAPVAYLMVKEITRGPTERVVARRGPPRRGAPEGEFPDRVSRDPGPSVRRAYRGNRRRWPYIAVPAALAFVIAVGVVTVPELIAGSSLTGERRTTFFGDAPVALSEPESSPEEPPAETEADPDAQEPDPAREPEDTPTEADTVEAPPDALPPADGTEVPQAAPEEPPSPPDPAESGDGSSAP